MSRKRRSPSPLESNSPKLQDIIQDISLDSLADWMNKQKETRPFDIASIEPAQLEALEHMVSSLAIGLDELRTKFSWLMSVNLDDVAARHPNALVRALAKRPKVQFAEKLMHDYKKGYLPILDDFNRIRLNPQLQLPPQFVGSLSAESLDALQAQLILNSQSELTALQTKFKNDEIVLRKTIDAVSLVSTAPSVGNNTNNDSNNDTNTNTNDNNTNNNSNNNSNTTSKRAETIKKSKLFKQFKQGLQGQGQQGQGQQGQGQQQQSTEWPPALPSIDDPELLKVVYTHKSVMDPGTKVQNFELLGKHNERLEFIGDSIIGFFVSGFLYNRFPNADEGFLSVAKATLVCNNTLFDIAVSYGMHEKLVVSEDLKRKMYKEGSNGQLSLDTLSRNKVIADVFESYVGGVATNKGLEVVEKWLRDVFKPFIVELRETEPLNKDAKNDLYRKIGSSEQSIEYLSANLDGPPFTVQCCVNGTVIGTGTDQSMKAAGLRAADEVLRNSRLVEKYAARRRNKAQGI